MGIRVILVEDESLISEMLGDMLEDLGHTVCGTLASGEGVVSEVLKEEPDLVIMDIKLKGVMTGIEAARAIKQARDIPIIYLTGYSDDGVVKQARETGAAGYLVKPVSKSDLRECIDRALGQQGRDKGRPAAR
jgi:CheY-like chemotaxis protein